ncbi:MAG: helicase-associated domain-containing protein [Chloroflexota bacterium]
MPDLVHSLQGRDLGHLRIVANLWGLDFEAPDARTGRQRLVPLLLAGRAAQDVTDALPGEARAALEDLIQHEGRLPWPLFTRRYGQVREMGHAARDRQRPWRNEASPAEALWYRALVARSFFDTPAGPEEFAYIPEDLLPLIPVRYGRPQPAERPEPVDRPEPFGRPATPSERANPTLATDHILDHATTLLAALRLGVTLEAALPFGLADLLEAAELLDANAVPLPEPTRAFLEAPRGEALSQLFCAWQPSSRFNELRQIPGLHCEGEWRNDPLRARQAVLGFLSSIEAGKWWSLNAFLADIRQRQPDFQRTAGDYDSWYIREEESGEYLRGFQNWEKVDGALVRYLIAGPLHWLGVLDVASSTPDGPVTAFRYSPWAEKLLRGEAPTGLLLEDKSIKVDSSARLIVPRLAPRPVRYQLARFAEWDAYQDDRYRYHITPATLVRARQQGLTVNHLLALLRRHAESVSPNLTKALARWEEHGVEATLESVTILRVSSPELLQRLRTSRAARFLGDPLGPTTVIVKRGAEQKVLDALAEMGYLGMELARSAG